MGRPNFSKICHQRRWLLCLHLKHSVYNGSFCIRFRRRYQLEKYSKKNPHYFTYVAYQSVLWSYIDRFFLTWAELQNLFVWLFGKCDHAKWTMESGWSSGFNPELYLGNLGLSPDRGKRHRRKQNRPKKCALNELDLQGTFLSTEKMW